MNYTLPAALLAVSITLSACNTATQTETAKPTQASTESADTTKPADPPPQAEWITMSEYKFKLEPDIQKDGEAHLDFYVHDAKDKHVLGVKGIFHITLPDGSKKSLDISEEKPYEHYHGKLMLEQVGQYQIVAQATINGQKFNPRFSFMRKQL